MTIITVLELPLTLYRNRSFELYNLGIRPWRMLRIQSAWHGYDFLEEGSKDKRFVLQNFKKIYHF